MTYDEFKAEYNKAFTAMMSYTCEQVGSGFYAEKMAELSDAYPEWADKVEEEA